MIVNYFGATWCGPCKMAKPYIKQSESKLTEKGHEVIFWDIDDVESEDMSERYEVQAVPTIVIVDEGNVVGTVRGWGAESQGEYDSIIEKYL